MNWTPRAILVQWMSCNNIASLQWTSPLDLQRWENKTSKSITSRKEKKKKRHSDFAEHVKKKKRAEQVEIGLKSEFVGGAYASYQPELWWGLVLCLNFCRSASPWVVMLLLGCSTLCSNASARKLWTHCKNRIGRALGPFMRTCRLQPLRSPVTCHYPCSLIVFKLPYKALDTCFLGWGCLAISSLQASREKDLNPGFQWFSSIGKIFKIRRR